MMPGSMNGGPMGGGMGGAGSSIAQALSAARRGLRGPGSVPGMADGGDPTSYDPLTSDYGGVRMSDPIGYAGATGMAGTQSGPAPGSMAAPRGSFRAHLMRMNPEERTMLLKQLGFSPDAFMGPNTGVEKFQHGEIPRNRPSAKQGATERAIAEAAALGREQGTVRKTPQEGAYGTQSGDTDFLGMWPNSPHRALFLKNPKYREGQEGYGTMTPEEIAQRERAQQYIYPKAAEGANLIKEAITPSPLGVMGESAEVLTKLHEMYDRIGLMLKAGKFGSDLAKEGKEDLEHHKEESHEEGYGENPFSLEDALLRVSREPPPDIAAIGAKMLKARTPAMTAPAGQKRGGVVSDKKKKKTVAQKALKAAKKTRRVARGK